MLGAGAIYAPDYEGSKDCEVLPFPYLAVGYKDIAYLRGPEIGVNIIRVEPADNMKISLGPVARYRRDRSEKRNRALVGLGKVDTAIEVGGAARLDVGRRGSSCRWSRMWRAVMKAWSGPPQSGVDFDLSDDLSLSLSGTTSWADNKYMRTYFGGDAGAGDAQRASRSMRPARASRTPARISACNIV